MSGYSLLIINNNVSYESFHSLKNVSLRKLASIKQVYT